MSSNMLTEEHTRTAVRIWLIMCTDCLAADASPSSVSRQPIFHYAMKSFKDDTVLSKRF